MTQIKQSGRRAKSVGISVSRVIALILLSFGIANVSLASMSEQIKELKESQKEIDKEIRGYQKEIKELKEEVKKLKASTYYDEVLIGGDCDACDPHLEHGEAISGGAGAAESGSRPRSNSGVPAVGPGRRNPPANPSTSPRRNQGTPVR